MGPYLKMIRIAACRDIALVPHNKAGWYFSDMQFVRKNMGSYWFFCVNKITIPTKNLATCPQPAPGIGFLNVGKKLTLRATKMIPAPCRLERFFAKFARLFRERSFFSHLPMLQVEHL